MMDIPQCRGKTMNEAGMPRQSFASKRYGHYHVAVLSVGDRRRHGAGLGPGRAAHGVPSAAPSPGCTPGDRWRTPRLYNAREDRNSGERTLAHASNRASPGGVPGGR